MNPYQTWKRYKGTERLLELARKDWPVLKEAKYPFFAGWDTETTGLHIIKDKPFLFIFGWLLPGEGNGRVFTFNPTPENMEICYKIAKQAKLFIAHNCKYDMSMMENIGLGYHEVNLCDSMAIARLAVEAKPEREGGDSLALKALGVKYVHPEAANSEKMVKAALKELNDKRIKHLTALLKQFPLEGETTPTGKQKYWGKGAIEKFLKDPTNDIEDLPEDIREIWLGWQEEYPEPTYADVPRETMDKYAAEDVITMLELVRKFMPIIKNREQFPILKREMEVMHPIWEMERVGMKTDQEYLLSSRKKMKQYIIAKRQRMYALAGAKIDCNQHEEVKNTFRRQWGIELASSDKAGLKKAMEYGGAIKEYAKLVTDLRTLEKWYSTYIERILAKSSYDGRFYTQINLEGAVSGRMSADVQQFPKGRILTDEGVTYEKEHGKGSAPDELVLFNPRRAFATSYDFTYYLDFSQIELRNQADWTIRVSGGDLNLCRAYMPFNCHKRLHLVNQSGKPYHTIPYDWKDSELRKEWDKFEWYLDESPETKWQKTDVHSETTHNALLLLGYECLEKYKSYRMQDGPFGNELDEHGFQSVRGKGKMANFAKNYGVGPAGLAEQLDTSIEVAEALCEGYNASFPGVITYQAAIQRAHALKGYVVNKYGRRYYRQNNREAYKLANYVVQGTCADMLKECIVKLSKYLKEKGYKTRMVIPIHDEIQFDVPKEEEHVIPELKAIMEDHTWHFTPVVSDIERTETYWSEKVGV